jgi:hypothetical protein
MKIGLVTRFFDLRNGGIGRFSMKMYHTLKEKGLDIIPVSTNRRAPLPRLMSHLPCPLSFDHGFLKGAAITLTRTNGPNQRFLRIYSTALRKMAKPIPSSGTFSRVQRG